MGISASSLLDETKSNFIKGQAENELKAFSPYFRKQFSVARFSQAEDDLEQQKEKITQLLRQREAPQEAEVLYEEAVLYFDDTRKWRERYIVVRANYCLECHESLETFVKGVPPRHKLLPTGGTVLVTEEKYMEMVDKCFPDDTNVKEDFTPPLSGMPGQFPVYLRLPYRRDSYFCFKQAAKQDAFISILSDCIRHQNQDFLKKKTCEVQAFLKAIQLYRQDKDKYEAWDMLIGSDVRVLANVVMEQLLPSLERDMLPRLKAKKTEKKRVWFATVEAAYILVQEHLLQGLSALKDECRASVRQQEVVMHSDMDQIVSCRRQLEEKVRDKVSEAAEKLCSERVQPYLGSILDELMEPISSGFQDGRELSDNMMDQVCRDVAAGRQNEELKEALAATLRPNLSSCYMKIGSLQQKLQNLQQRFGFSNMSGIVHSAQIDLQQLTQNAAHTFEQLLLKAMKDNPDGACAAIEKAKHRVLKQYDYDSSTVRKRIFQEALVSITLPFIKKNLAPTCKAEVQSLEQFIYADHSNFIHVENVYESVLLQTLDKEVTKVVKEAASLKKYNLFTDRDLVSQSSRSSLSSPTTSTPGSPAMALASPPKVQSEPQPPSPLVVNGLPSSPKSEDLQDKEDSAPPGNTSVDVTVMETPLGKVELKETVAAELTVAAETTVAIEMTVTQSKAGTEKSETPKPDEVQVAAEAAVALETAAFPNTSASDETQEGKAAAPEIQVQEQPISETETMPTAAEPSAEAPQEAETVLIPSTDDSLTETEAAAAETVPCVPLCPSSELSSEVPSSDQVSVVTLADDELQEEGDKAEPLTISDPNSLDVSVGSESPPSDIESTEDVRAVQSSKDEVSMTSEVLKDEANRSKSPESSDDAPEDKGVTEETSNPQTQMEAASEDAGTSEDVGASEDVGVSCEAATSITVEASAEVTTSTSSQPAQDEARPPDCIKDIRDLVEEVIEVEELVQRYPSGVPKDE